MSRPDPYGYAPAAVDRRSRPAMSRAAVCIRMFLVTVPAQVAAALVAGVLLGAAGLPPAALSAGIAGLAAVAAGFAVGLLVRAPAVYRRTGTVLSGLFGAGTWLLLTVLARAAVTAGGAPAASWVVGPLLVGLVQAGVSAAVWAVHRPE